MASSTRLLMLAITVACVPGMATSSYCGKDKTHTIGPYYWTSTVFLPNASEFYIASVNGSTDVVTFGGLLVYNSPLTSGPLTTDPPIGRAQGFFVQTDPSLTSGVSVFSFVLPNGAITFNCYTEGKLFLPHQTNRCGITSGNGGYRHLIKGYTEFETYSVTIGGDQAIVVGNVVYCL